jgi:hypothetical protein
MSIQKPYVNLSGNVVWPSPGATPTEAEWPHDEITDEQLIEAKAQHGEDVALEADELPEPPSEEEQLAEQELVEHDDE